MSCDLRKNKMTLETLAASLSSEAVDSWCLEDIPSPIEVSNFGDKDFGTDQDLFFSLCKTELTIEFQPHF